jgi:signal transduction histidine kinase
VNWIERRLDRSEVVNPVPLDSVAAALLAVAALTSSFTQEVRNGLVEPGVAAAATAILSCAPVAFRRVVPLTAMIAGTAFVVAHVALDYPEGTLPVTLLFLTFSVAVASDQRHALAGLGVAYLANVLLGVSDAPGVDTPTFVANFAWFGAAWLIGIALRARRQTLTAQVREADERAELLIQSAARAVAEERLRIAQELHDVVAHSISVIAVQAGVGSHFLEEQGPKQTRDALTAIGDTSRRTLAELRRLLGALRGDDGPKRNTPAPTLDQLPALIDQTRQLGVDVTLDQEGISDGHHLAIEMSAYRIVQEALTNVIKHAGTTTDVRVCVAHRARQLDLEITDDGRGAATGHNGSPLPSGRHGLLGMRERVELWGGSLSTGPRPGGGYRVAATIPYEADE